MRSFTLGSSRRGPDRERQVDGVEVEDATWARVRATIDRLGIGDKLPGVP